MSRNILPKEKLQAVKEYLDGKGSYDSIAKKYGVTSAPFRKWIAKYRTFGESAFIRTGHNACYSSAFKHKVVNAYICGEGSLQELAVKYKIPSNDTISKWVLKYNGHEKLKAYGAGGKTIMIKGRKTTFEERVEIVQYCIAHEHNYKETSEKYQISYQQARGYTVKYEKVGIDGLQDRRGKCKPEAEMNELEKLRAENKILRAEKERAEMEVSFLKKLEEIERRRG
ncbi:MULTISPECIES: helix-turn-helix domain-containing protein [Clostridium]|jgi:transposase-like protein|uniref:Transposase n=2 Tax=Clostridium TaxID=1485 RepID=A0A1V4I3I6_9CLOT|nr:MULTISPECIES: helix-turn-helix domain-containing protein [Clostridium]MBC2459258.1 transposase [Clostridium beijerinckii]MBC2476788.1 transposase [Clostridium beijerinckii]MCI1580506.1 transposase [Clostridium beijerinckii]MCI1585675.1 transposase [Clostridium beijerinckii]MCI1624976.1 transposase [Clostridium beijerinckii]